MGVLQGAERFDHTRGYKFSTYVQYWIRKSMSMMVSRHARGVHIPVCAFCLLTLFSCLSRFCFIFTKSREPHLFSFIVSAFWQSSIIRTINQIQKARKTLKTSHGIKYPADEEISKLTSLSVKKIRAANQCLKVVGSIEKKVGDCFTTKFLVCHF